MNRPGSDQGFKDDEGAARQLDSADPLSTLREQFCMPIKDNGEPYVYFCGNSLGLQPKAARERVIQELDDWEKFAVRGHFEAETPWFSYHEVFREKGARLVGANAGEVVMMNSLTVNLHLMMVSFYRPTPERHKILVEASAFPSDQYAVQTQVQYHGYDPVDAVVVARPRAGENTLRTEDLEALIEEQGHEIALVMLGGVNYYTGQAFDMKRITAAAHTQGCMAGFDLAHGAGNLHLQLHDWNVDFAVWCTYKYLNASPGAVAGCFVHERHGKDASLPRFAGWWGNDPESRFQMPDTFTPRAGADGWQCSNPPIMALAPLVASMEIFDEVGMEALCERSSRLTGYLEFLVDEIPGEHFEIITPRDPDQRGCQLSIRIREDAERVRQLLEDRGVLSDFRRPDVVRVAPVPLYNTFHDVWSFARILAGAFS